MKSKLEIHFIFLYNIEIFVQHYLSKSIFILKLVIDSALASYIFLENMRSESESSSFEPKLEIDSRETTPALEICHRKTMMAGGYDTLAAEKKQKRKPNEKSSGVNDEKKSAAPVRGSEFWVGRGKSTASRIQTNSRFLAKAELPISSESPKVETPPPEKPKRKYNRKRKPEDEEVEPKRSRPQSRNVSTARAAKAGELSENSTNRRAKRELEKVAAHELDRLVPSIEKEIYFISRYQGGIKRITGPLLEVVKNHFKSI